MRAQNETPFVHRFSRAALALAFLAAMGASTAAGALPPADDAGGPGGAGGGGDVTEMLRGEYSPIDISSEIPVITTTSEGRITEMLRGEYSPIL